MDTNSNADASREAARLADGKFGTQEHGRPQRDLSADIDRLADEEAVDVMVAAMKDMSVDEATELADHLIETSWTARHRLGMAIAWEDWDEVTERGRDAMSHLDDQMDGDVFRSAEVAACDALRSVSLRRHVDERPSWGMNQYLELTRPWQRTMNITHPADDLSSREEFDQALAELEDPAYEHYDSMLGRMDEYDISTPEVSFFAADGAGWNEPAQAPF